MMIFLILPPSAAFALLMLVTSAEIALFAAAATGLAVIASTSPAAVAQDARRGLRGAVSRGSALYLTLIDPDLSASAIKLAVDAGMFAVSLGSILIRASPSRCNMPARWSMPKPRAARLHHGELYHHLGLDRLHAADDGRQRRD